jgi:ABC-type molybdenum transport system ATPase subunit/photorepair protein PhrA
MAQRNYESKNKKSSVERISSGFNDLIGVYADELKENSEEIAEVLQLLQRKELNKANIKELKKIKRELKRIDSVLDDLGEE